MYIYVDFIDILRRYVEISPFFRHNPRLMPHSSRLEEQLSERGVAEVDCAERPRTRTRSRHRMEACT
ncbi:hypothetical protein CJ199_00900 [Brevibacterium paucivorans]|uniref:Uncharacterized protein n=1 Tax=Brevibacterium paucivorans TaxID=170994 RepID=A0A2N6VPH2_9MICO|nr:hypothetical protein CJ199_00900 [Brevibacterium paucivorans]